MDSLLHIAVIGLVAVVFVNVLRKNSAELALMLTLAACCVISILLIQLCRPVIQFLKQLRNISGLDHSLMEPMLKAIGIGLLTNLSANICTDTGQGAIARLIELSGTVLALYVSLPLFEAVIQMMQSLGGGR